MKWLHAMFADEMVVMISSPLALSGMCFQLKIASSL
jgi:hypothetical protein